ncbi:MAG TPA: glycosyltransferase family 4 protein [Dissulfurispiraceae bacterium]|nr:glycosyltransferase family 4 protein [Dissulfurispiraceae bacterium]
MKIFFVSLFLPQKKAYHAGGRYVFEIIKNLAKNHEIYLATRLEESEFSALEELKSVCKEIYPYTYKTKAKRNFFDSARLIINYAGFSLFANGIAHNGGFDLIHVEWVEAALMVKGGKTPMVLDAHDVITKPAERSAKKCRGIGKAAGYLRYRLVRALEIRIAGRFDMVFTRSENDKAYLLSIAPGLNVGVIPHPAGLDITGRKVGREKNTMLFLASYKYRKVNVDGALYFYRNVFPLIWASVPDAKYVIAGYGPPEELISIQKKDPGVLVPGYVDDIDECYKKAAVFVAPIMIGGGVIVKIIDAMAAGTPVVTTSYGNEGIGAVHGRDLLVADDPHSFAAAVLRVLGEKGLAETLSQNGRDFVRTHFSLETVIAG